LFTKFPNEHGAQMQPEEIVPTMHRHAGLLCVPLLLAACGPSPQQRTTSLLDRRLLTQLTPEIATGRAVLQPLPDGARVTLLAPGLFPNDAKTLDDQTVSARADLIEGLLDPSLMRVQVADNSALPPYQRDTRVRNVQQYFIDNGLGPVLAPSAAVPPGAGPAGLTLTISVQCPPPNGLTGYGDGKSHPVCE
jgi:hypothetical protein